MPMSQMLWMGRKRQFSIIRTVDQNFTGTSAVQDDQLGWITEPNHVYWFEHLAEFATQNFGFNLKYTHAGTTTMFFASAFHTLRSIGGSGYDDNLKSADVLAINTNFVSVTAASVTTPSTFMRCRGILVVGATGGLFVPEYTWGGNTGQRTSFAGSMLRGVDITP